MAPKYYTRGWGAHPGGTWRKIFRVRARLRPTARVGCLMRRLGAPTDRACVRRTCPAELPWPCASSPQRGPDHRGDFPIRLGQGHGHRRLHPSSPPRRQGRPNARFCGYSMTRTLLLCRLQLRHPHALCDSSRARMLATGPYTAYSFGHPADRVTDSAPCLQLRGRRLGGASMSCELNTLKSFPQWHTLWAAKARRVGDGWTRRVMIPFRDLSYDVINLAGASLLALNPS